MAVRPIDAGSLRDNITDIYGGSDRLIYLADVLSLIDAQPTLTPPNEPLSPYPDGDTSILACPCCGSGEYLHNEDGNEQNYCGQCGQAIDWSRPPEGENV